MKHLKIVLILMSCLLMSCSELVNQHKSFNIDQLSVEEKIGQLCLVSIYSSNHDTILRTIQEKHIGGVILYKENRYPETSLVLKKSLTNIAAKSNSNIPIFTSIDHEGIGLGHHGTQFPRMMALGYLDDLDLTETVGFIMGQELHAAGIDVVYAPVLDVNLSASNTVIGARSFSDQPKAVAKHGRAFITGILNGQTIPVAKHFPGHGLTVQDSHIGLPMSSHSKQDIKRLALAPFKYSKQVPMVMTAHIFFSKLDADYPATLSESILTTLLRKKMKYKGVVITDHMDMKAVRKDLSLEEASLKAIQAGSDIIMLGENLNQIRSVIDFLVEAVNDGRLSMTRLNQAVQRVVDMKLNYALFNTSVDDSYKTILRQQSSLDVAESIIKNSVHIVQQTQYKRHEAVKKALVVSGQNQFNTTLIDALKDKNITSTLITLEKPLTHSEKWSYISKIMTEQLELDDDLEDLIKNDKRVSESLKKSIKSEAQDVDLVVVGIQTAAQAEDLNQLAKDINIPVVGLFFGTRYDAPLLYQKCPDFYASIIAYNNYYTQKKALPIMIDKLFSMGMF